MKPSDNVFVSAVPHEAGHVLVAYCFHVAVRRIAYRIGSESEGRIMSEIAVPSRVSHELTDGERQAHCLIAAGGMAGELVATGGFDRANLSPLSADQKILATLTSTDITGFLQPAQEIISRNKRAFDSLCAATRERYPKVREQIISSRRLGLYPLLSKEDLDKLLGGVT